MVIPEIRLVGIIVGTSIPKITVIETNHISKRFEGIKINKVSILDVQHQLQISAARTDGSKHPCKLPVSSKK